MKIVIGCDHAGFPLKEELKSYLLSKEVEVIDCGCDSLDSVHYPLYGYAVGEKVMELGCFGIVVCGSGIGISIAANKVKGIRCANVNSVELAKLSRQHNNANVIGFGARFINKEEAIEMLEAFLNTPFDGGRHQIRTEMLDKGNK